MKNCENCNHKNICFIRSLSFQSGDFNLKRLKKKNGTVGCNHYQPKYSKDKEKQIEEIANVICSFCRKMTEDEICERGAECYEFRQKEALFYYEQGIRKIDTD